MGECILPFRKGGAGGIGSTMVVSHSHEGNDASIYPPLDVEYYQNLIQGDLFNSITLKKAGVAVPVERTIFDRSKIRLDKCLLEESTKYDFEVPVGAVKDKLGNVLKGVYRYSFTTGLVPYFIVTPEATKAAFDTVVERINRDGGAIYFTEGEFRGLFPIKITHSDVLLKGEGVNTKIICDTPNSGAKVGVIGVVGTSAVHVANVKICDMVIDGDYSSDNANREYYVVYLKCVDSSVIDGAVVQNNKEGIFLFSSNNNTITGNTVQNNSSRGGYISNSDNNIVTGNTVQNNSFGLYLQSSNNNTVTGNTIQNNSNKGITLNTSSSNNTIIDNIFQNNRGDGIWIASPANNNTVTGNTIQNNGDNGIRLQGLANNNAVSGNTVQNNSGDGIKIDSGCNNNVILANKYNSITNGGTNNIISQNITA